MEETRIPLAGIRKIIGERLRDSVVTIPHIWASSRVVATPLLQLMKALEEKGRKIPITVFIAKALGITLTEIPELNSRLEENEIVRYSQVNPGIAVTTDKGLLVVTLRDAGNKGLFEISEEFRGLMEKVKTKKLTLEDTKDSTVTISNLSKERVISFSSIINNNECVIAGIGGVHKEPAALPDGSVAAQDVLMLTVNLNHTIVDGIFATRFLNRMQELLEQPERHLLSAPEKEAAGLA